MRFGLLLFFLLSSFYVKSQYSVEATQLRTLSEKLKTSTKLIEGTHDEFVDFDIFGDTLYINRISRVVESGQEFESHFFLKINDVATSNLEEVDNEGYNAHTISFASINNANVFIYIEGSKEYMENLMANGGLTTDNYQSEAILGLPQINNSAKYQELSEILESLID